MYQQRYGPNQRRNSSTRPRLNMSDRPKESKPSKVFIATNLITGEQLEGILYDNGTCMLGPDMFRALDKFDMPSYKTYFFPTLDKVKEKYKLQKPKRRGFFLENNETGGNDYGTKRNFS